MNLTVSFSTNETDLYYEFWRFVLLGDRLVLDYYVVCDRLSKRHRFVEKKVYNRLMRQYCTICVSEVPYDDKIVQLAKQTMMNQITVHKF